MNIKDILFLYDYNYWANRKILTASEGVTHEQFTAPASFPFGGLRGTLVHTVDAERIWRVLFETEIVTQDQDLVATDFPTFELLEKKFHEEEELMRAYLNRLSDEDMDSHLKLHNHRRRAPRQNHVALPCPSRKSRQATSQ